jgi:hypothetical protein
MADWSVVPQAASAREQYRFAQLGAAESQRVASWLAVPGRFPSAADWGDRAYTQLIRTLLRRGDAPRLEALAAELAAAGRRPTAANLAQFARAGSSALLGRAEEVLGGLDSVQFDRLDPGLAALGFEIAQMARRTAASPSSSLTARLDRLGDQAAQALQITQILRLDVPRSARSDAPASSIQPSS